MKIEAISEVEILDNEEMYMVLASGGKPMYPHIYRETAIDYCVGNQLAICPRLRARFIVDSRILAIPHIDIVESIFSDSDDTPLGMVEATLELIPDQDRLLFEVKEAWPK